MPGPKKRPSRAGDQVDPIVTKKDEASCFTALETRAVQRLSIQLPHALREGFQFLVELVLRLLRAPVPAARHLGQYLAAAVFSRDEVDAPLCRDTTVLLSGWNRFSPRPAQRPVVSSALAQFSGVRQLSQGCSRPVGDPLERGVPLVVPASARDRPGSRRH